MRLFFNIIILTFVLFIAGCDDDDGNNLANNSSNNNNHTNNTQTNNNNTNNNTGSCGNGIVEETELCDGDCPELCADGDACTIDVMVGTSETCDATCTFTVKTACVDNDGCCPSECDTSNDSDCGVTKPVVVLVISIPYNNDPRIRSRITRYREDHPLYNFYEILLEINDDPVTDMTARGGEIKHNFVEVRNSIKQFQLQTGRVIGVWLISENVPRIWREESIFAIPSAFKASIYPLTSFADDYYISYDAMVGGFVEYEGATIGRSRGDGYPSDIWGAVLTPPAGFGDPYEMIVDFFDRNHENTLAPATQTALLYSDTFGFTSALPGVIENSECFSSDDTVFLGPNTTEELGGFSSFYYIMVHKQGEGFVPSGSSGCLMANGDAEIAELNTWAATQWFTNQLEFRKIGDDRCYFFSMLIDSESLPLADIKQTLEASLPALACADGQCVIYVMDALFGDASGIPNDGQWASFPAQQDAFETLYSSNLSAGNVLYSYISTHGSPDYHHFGITSQSVFESSFSALVYELQACSTADIAITDMNIASSYLFFGNAQVVTGYAQPSLIQCVDNNCFDFARFLNIRAGQPLVDALFDRDYSMHIYMGDPLLTLPTCVSTH
ncbi:hypothetical protein KKF34_06725 [Myxococcota bacterium]|nr:hypothetical protein [Myxococcota bacterium]MBU1380038.1 hypothetical protein [Myxococcota bacterium]MBU1496554.1 hypothetical protein [Myxococcota bacterium]